MIQKESVLKVIDNSGVRKARCIHVYGKKMGSMGDLILVSILKSGARLKIQKGSLQHAVIVQLKSPIVYKTGMVVKFLTNSIVLVKKGTKLPLSKRIKGKVYLPLKRLGYSRLVLISLGSI